MKSFLVKIIFFLVDNILKRATPEQGLRFLLQLDNYIYHWQGIKAVEYGNGVHTKHRHTRYHDFLLIESRKILEYWILAAVMEHCLMISRNVARQSYSV